MRNKSLTSPQLPSLIETDWLRSHLADPVLHILECTVFINSGQDGVRFESGDRVWSEGHIPGSRFVDLIKDLSDPNSKFPFMLPSADQFTEVMERHGIGEGVQVVLYDRAKTIWAARVWWMLRCFGFDQTSILNGGWHKWSREGRPVSTEVSDSPPAKFQVRLRPELITNLEQVQAILGNEEVCLIHTLEQNSYRQCRIPNSVNVPAVELLDPDTEAFLPLETLRQRFIQSGATNGKRIITYCGAGITSCSDAFILTLLDYPNISMYDGSLAEWTADPKLPIEKD